jgi:hypothetical protein
MSPTVLLKYQGIANLALTQAMALLMGLLYIVDLDLGIFFGSHQAQ